MGSFEWACPSCGQKQVTKAPNGTEVSPRLCAACAETHAAKVGLTEAGEIENNHTRETAREAKGHTRAHR